MADKIQATANQRLAEGRKADNCEDPKEPATPIPERFRGVAVSTDKPGAGGKQRPLDDSSRLKLILNNARNTINGLADVIDGWAERAQNAETEAIGLRARVEALETGIKEIREMVKWNGPAAAHHQMYAIYEAARKLLEDNHE